MCAKCECKKEHKWVGQQYVNSEGEIVAQVQVFFDHLLWNDRRFIDLEAAKAAIEKHFSQTPSDSDMIARIRDVIKKAAAPSRFGPPSSAALFMTIRRIVETPQK